MIKKIALITAMGLAMTGSVYAKTVVAYFSATGTTKALAEKSAKVLGADLFEIVPEVPYTSADLDWHDSQSRTTVEANTPSSRPKIRYALKTEDYDTVVLAFPIYWYTAPKIVWTFVETNSLADKKVIPICTSGGSGIRDAVNDLKALTGDAVQWKRGSRFYRDTSEQELKAYFDQELR